MTTDIAQYTPAGEEVTYDYDAIDSPDSELVGFDRGWGLQFEDKALLDGQTITIVGMRPAADFGLGDTVALRFRFDGDDGEQEPWGVLFSVTSPIVQQAAAHFRRYGNVRLRAKIVKTPSKTNKGFSFWTLDKPDPMNVSATPADEPSSRKGGK